MACRQSFVNRSESGFTGQPSWQRQADGSWVASTEAQTVGELQLACTFRWKAPVGEAVFSISGARVSYLTAPSRSAASGIVVEVAAKQQRPCRISGLRITGEDWLELGSVRYLVRFAEPVRSAQVVFRLVDTATVDALRADLKEFSLSDSADKSGARECPETGMSIGGQPSRP